MLWHDQTKVGIWTPRSGSPRPSTRCCAPDRPRNSRALAARQARTEASLDRVREVVSRMLKDKTITMAAVARRADVSRTFPYDNHVAKQVIETAAAQAAGRRVEGREAEQQALEASWRERALNSEDALKTAHGEILRQGEQIAELLGQIRELDTGWTEDDRIRMTSKNLALKRTVRDQEAEILSRRQTGRCPGKQPLRRPQDR